MCVCVWGGGGSATVATLSFGTEDASKEPRLVVGGGGDRSVDTFNKAGPYCFCVIYAVHL